MLLTPPAPTLSAKGLTGATAAGRWVGTTTGGAPASGTFVVGDWVDDQTGAMWVCTVAGSPGTWVEVGAAGNIVTSVFTRTGAVVAATGDYTPAQVHALAVASNLSDLNSPAIARANLGGTLLALVAYAPSIDTVETVSSASPTVLDATNLTISFTVPASGKVLAVLSAWCFDTGGISYWGLADHTSSTGVGTLVAMNGSGIVAANAVFLSARFPVTGLVAGTAAQWDWVACSTANAAKLAFGPAQVATASGNRGPGLMEIWGMP